MMRIPIIFIFLVGFVLSLSLNVQAKPPTQGDFQPYEEVWRLGHGYFTDLEWRPDGEVLAMATSQGIRFYNQDMDEIDFWEMDYLISPQWAHIAWSPDGRYLATTEYNHELDIWDYETGEKLSSYVEEFEIWDIEWHGDSKELGYTVLSHELSPNDKFYVWNFRETEPEQISLGFDQVEWSNYYNTFLLGGFENGIQLIDLVDKNHQSISQLSIFDLAVSPNGTKALIYGSEIGIALLDLETQVTNSTVEGQYSEIIEWNSTSSAVALAGRDGFVIWDIESGEIRHDIDPEFKVFHIAWHPAQNLIVYASPYEMSYWLGDTSTGHLGLSSGEQYLERLNRLYPHPETLIGWETTGKKLALIHGRNIGIWDVETHELILQTTMVDNPLHAIEWNPTQDLILGTTGGHGYLWSTETGDLLRQYDFSSDWIKWHPNGTSFTANPNSSEGAINMYDLETGTSLLEFPHWGLNSNLVWTLDSQHIISVGTWTNDYVQVWNAETGDLVNLFMGENATVSFDGSNIAILYRGSIYIQDFETGIVKYRFPGDTVAWHPNGRIIAIETEDAAIDLWDIETGELRQHLEGHQIGINTMAWSPDGKYLASAGYDFTLRFWSVTP